MSGAAHFGPAALGDAMAELAIPITASTIVAGAMATGDFEPVHHDAAAARTAGMPDIFLNILTTNGIVQRYVRAWSGPGAMTRRVALRLGVPVTPGDVLVLRGTVAWSEAAPSAIVTVVGSTGRGVHVTAELELTAS
jgi:acyl dehydratase